MRGSPLAQCDNPPTEKGANYRDASLLNQPFQLRQPPRHRIAGKLHGLDRSENWRVLNAPFTDRDYLKPRRTAAQVTESLAALIAEVAKSLQRREAGVIGKDAISEALNPQKASYSRRSSTN
ncbi:MAG TPA: hypothetical protein DCE44_06950, partial [Verrucomicrobiales bacterium]|nr:hypothetical protein [Verrucomicrobiales bacterium]